MLQPSAILGLRAAYHNLNLALYIRATYAAATNMVATHDSLNHYATRARLRSLDLKHAVLNLEGLDAECRAYIVRCCALLIL